MDSGVQRGSGGQVRPPAVLPVPGLRDVPAGPAVVRVRLVRGDACVAGEGGARDELVHASTSQPSLERREAVGMRRNDKTYDGMEHD